MGLKLTRICLNYHLTFPQLSSGMLPKFLCFTFPRVAALENILGSASNALDLEGIYKHLQSWHQQVSSASMFMEDLTLFLIKSPCPIVSRTTTHFHRLERKVNMLDPTTLEAVRGRAHTLKLVSFKDYFTSLGLSWKTSKERGSVQVVRPIKFSRQRRKLRTSLIMYPPTSVYVWLIPGCSDYRCVRRSPSHHITIEDSWDSPSRGCFLQCSTCWSFRVNHPPLLWGRL